MGLHAGAFPKGRDRSTLVCRDPPLAARRQHTQAIATWRVDGPHTQVPPHIACFRTWRLRFAVQMRPSPCCIKTSDKQSGVAQFAVTKTLPIVLACCRRRSERHSRNLLHVAAISVRRAGGAAFVCPRSSQGVSRMAVGLSKAMLACMCACYGSACVQGTHHVQPGCMTMLPLPNM